MLTRVVARVLLVAVCVAGVTASVLTYVSQTRLKVAYDNFLVTKDWGHALDDLRASDSPLVPSVPRDIGVAVSLLRVGRGAEGERVIAESARRNRGDVRTLLTLAGIQASRHHLAAAQATYNRAREINPALRPGAPRPF